jgi:hypothetical protein
MQQFLIYDTKSISKNKKKNYIIYTSSKLKTFVLQKVPSSWVQWLMPIILATQEAEIRRIVV